MYCCCCCFLDYSLEDYKRCTEAGLKVGANIKGVYVSVGFEGGDCNGLLNEFDGELSLIGNGCPGGRRGLGER